MDQMNSYICQIIRNKKPPAELLTGSFLSGLFLQFVAERNMADTGF